MANNYQGRYNSNQGSTAARTTSNTSSAKKGMKPAAVVKVVVSKGKGVKPEYMDSGLIFFANTDESGKKKGYSIKLRSDVTIPAGTKLSLFLND